MSLLGHVISHGLISLYGCKIPHVMFILRSIPSILTLINKKQLKVVKDIKDHDSYCIAAFHYSVH